MPCALPTNTKASYLFSLFLTLTSSLFSNWGNSHPLLWPWLHFYCTTLIPHTFAYSYFWRGLLKVTSSCSTLLLTSLYKPQIYLVGSDSSDQNNRDVVQYYHFSSIGTDRNSTIWGLFTVLIIIPYFTFIKKDPD